MTQKTHFQINRPKKSAYKIGLTDLGGTQRLEAIHRISLNAHLKHAG